MTATPEGTVYARAAMGSELYRFAPGAPEARRIRLRGAPYGPLAALPDGSVALLNTMDRRLWRVEAERVREVPLGANPDAWPTAMAVGPEGTLWIYYPVERRIKIHAPTGELLDSVLPLMDFGQPIEASAMAVYDPEKAESEFKRFTDGIVPHIERKRKPGYFPMFQMGDVWFKVE